MKNIKMKNEEMKNPKMNDDKKISGKILLCVENSMLEPTVVSENSGSVLVILDSCRQLDRLD